MFPSNATRTFCGLPIGVITLPTVTPKATAYRKGLSSTFRTLATLRRMGVNEAAIASLLATELMRPETTKLTAMTFLGSLYFAAIL